MGERAKAVVIHGLRDLLGTSLVTALGARGFDVTAAEQASGPAIALVDLDVPGSAHAVGRAARRGWTVIGLASDDVAVAAAVAAGATGCFPKSAPLPKLTRAPAVLLQAGEVRPSRLLLHSSLFSPPTIRARPTLVGSGVVVDGRRRGGSSCCCS